MLLVIGAGCGKPTPELPPAPTFVLSGAITRDGRPARNASVHVDRTPLGVVVNDRGEFRIPGVRGGRQHLSVVYLGYRSRPVPFTVPGDSADGVTLELVADPGLGPPLAGDDPTLVLSYRVSGGS